MLRDSKGFTVIELIVGIGIAMIFLASIGSVVVIARANLIETEKEADMVSNYYTVSYIRESMDPVDPDIECHGDYLEVEGKEIRNKDLSWKLHEDDNYLFLKQGDKWEAYINIPITQEGG